VELVGRQHELGQLQAARDEACAGRGQLVLLTGEPGIGKSTLAAAVVAGAAADFAITQGRAWELGDAPAYFPLRPCLRALGLEPQAGGDAEAFALWERVLAALAQAAAARPVLWVLEDLHAADAQTLDLLCFLAQPLRSIRALVVVTLRAKDPRLDLPAQRRIARLRRDGLEIPLGPLDSPQVAALAARQAGRTLPPAVLAELTVRTGGNPLFVVECARAWRGGAPGLVLPATVEVLVQERLELLPERARLLLTSAAALGEEFSVATLGAMTELLPARVIDDLRPAIGAGTIEETAPGRFRFSHGLVRDATYATLSSEARLRVHARAAAALATSDDPRAAVERAHHALAGRTPDCLAIADEQISLLSRQSTFDRALALCRLALEVRKRPRDVVQAARLALAAGQFADSRQLALEALALARAQDDPDSFAQAALVLGGEFRPGIRDAVLVQHLEEALLLLDPAPSPLRCRVSARLAAALQPAPDPMQPVAMARQAIADARAMNDPALVRDVLLVATSALVDICDPTEVRGLSAELLDLAGKTGDHAAALRAYFRLVLAEMQLGDFAAMDAHLDAMLGLAGAVGHPRLAWHALLLGSMRAIARGQFDESERFTDEAQRLSTLTDDPALVSTLGAHMLLRVFMLHRTEEAEQALATLDFTTAHLPIGPILRPVMRTLTWAWLGDNEKAARAFAGLRIEDALSRGFGSGLGEIVAAVGTRDLQTRVRDHLVPLADRELSFGHSALMYFGPVRRVLGLLEAALGDEETADRHLTAALEVSRRRGLLTWVSRITFELGSLRGKRGRALLEESAALADSIGIAGLAHRARALLGTPPPARAPPPERARLAIARERDVWRISYGERQIRVQHSRGMELLERLVAHAGEEVHVLVLASDTGEALIEADSTGALDVQAARGYRRRLGELEAEIERAEEDADIARRERLVREQELLRAELSRAFGLGGAARRGGASERARVNVQRRIKDAIGRIAEHDAELGAYLRRAIRTGTSCTFRP
jgi:tetratricopeptide (TPR) repeat protein